jgi:hypothetical protein
MSAQPELLAGPAQTQVPADLEALFNTNDYVDLSALDSTTTSTPNMGNNTQLPTGFTPRASGSGSYERSDSFGTANGAGMGYNIGQTSQGGQTTMMEDFMNDSMNMNVGGNGNGNSMTFDLGQNGLGYGGEMLAGEGMDTVSDGLRGGDQNQGL